MGFKFLVPCYFLHGGVACPKGFTPLEMVAFFLVLNAFGIGLLALGPKIEINTQLVTCYMLVTLAS